MPSLRIAIRIPSIHSPSDNLNPYRVLVRRRFSEPLLALLFFILGLWLWDNHMGASRAHAPDSIQLALRKADRDLQLAQACQEIPPALRALLGIESLPFTLAASIHTLEELRLHPAFGEADRNEAAFAIGVLTALQADANPATGPFQQLGLPAPPPPAGISRRLRQGAGFWWDLAYLQGVNHHNAPEAASLVRDRTQTLVRYTIASRGALLLLTAASIPFIPATLLAFLKLRHRRPSNEKIHWTTSFGIGVFLIASLGHIGFSTSLNLMIQKIAEWPTPTPGNPVVPTPAFLLLDALTRLLPACIALAFLFRRSTHAVSRLDLNGPLAGRTVLGAFAILQIIDFGFRNTLFRLPDPSLGTLSPAESGPWGLIFTITSACFIAPIAEEILYRGVLFRSLANHLRLPAAAAISAILFALVHFYPLPSLILVGAVGFTCALAYASSRSLLTAVALHALYNAAQKIPEWMVYHAPLA